jgi:hypothetical protein
MYNLQCNVQKNSLNQELKIEVNQSAIKVQWI